MTFAIGFLAVVLVVLVVLRLRARARIESIVRTAQGHLAEHIAEQSELERHRRYFEGHGRDDPTYRDPGPGELG